MGAPVGILREKRTSHWCALRGTVKGKEVQVRLKGEPTIIGFEDCFTIFVNLCPLLIRIKISLNSQFVLQIGFFFLFQVHNGNMILNTHIFASRTSFFSEILTHFSSYQKGSY